ncbi:UDP-2,4-diacetamido-2,4,6-trideoxy-beta-L-altropyranose hydrolase [Viridibacillus arvi]|uniref:UDP-2,4-diacetamido-2,4, 6-trideoxy-beta-L-altropyranose hydrolase n=1 Tax=Viridibacillus arvi TaxID=263475 RepID=UPI003D013B0E
MQVFIRTDASIQIGSGHVMRCLTLAHQLREENFEVTFICRNLSGNMNRYIENKGFKVEILRSVGDVDEWRWMEDHFQEDVSETILYLTEQKVDLIIVDHYAIDEKWEQSLRPYVEKIMVIDDLANRRHDCDLILDTTFEIDYKKYRNLLLNKKNITLLGSQFALLRKSFLEGKKNRFYCDESSIKIHIFFGGMDKSNYTYKFSELLLENLNNIEILAVVGEKYEYISSLVILKKRFKDRFRFFVNVSNMALTMGSADIAIGAPGTTTWERACVGLPSLYLSTANNQKNLLEHLEDKGICIFLGEADSISNKSFIHQVQYYINHIHILDGIFTKGQEAVDGKGIYRVVKRINSLFNKE